MTTEESVMRQQERVRRSGETNMFDLNQVQRIAFERKFHELGAWIEDHDAAEYVEMAEESAERYRGTESLGDSE